MVPREKELDKFTSPSNLVIIYKSTATFDEEIIHQYLNTLFADKKHRLDTRLCHLTPYERDSMKTLDLQPIIILPRMTNILQPVCWFASIKRAYCSKWSEWNANELKEKTIYNNT